MAPTRLARVKPDRGLSVTESRRLKRQEQQVAWRRRGAGFVRPPWTDEGRVRALCTSCGDCIAACPEAILRAGPARTPIVDFLENSCTFCRDCAAACGEGVFRDETQTPWTLTARLGAACLLRMGVSCRSCTDACDAHALRFDLRAGPVGAIHVDHDACTGCGACVGVCPAGAVTMAYGAAPRVEAAE
ncbi:ferredoxin-type protein NapF [Rhodovulum imhoffii]|nr:ferredoxin-type protein NapF [Rhodovulum imhoffii]MBK5935070.1 ferredoxin-type protein NapF [Rhodovulum imhoffii]